VATFVAATASTTPGDVLPGEEPPVVVDPGFLAVVGEPAAVEVVDASGSELDVDVELDVVTWRGTERGNAECFLSPPPHAAPITASATSAVAAVRRRFIGR
jgi:hypothetical protein